MVNSKNKVIEEKEIEEKNKNGFKVYLNPLKELKDYESKLLYLAIAIFGFLFYTLAYVFFYGYYFGGKSKEIPSVLQVLINPVPFNFKSLTILGIIFVCGIAAFSNITMKISKNLELKSKLIIMDMILLIVLILIVHILFTTMFIGKIDFRIEYLRIWMVPAFMTVYYAIASLGKIIDAIIGFFNSLLICILVLVIATIFKFNVPQTGYAFLLLIVWITTSILLTYINLKKTIIYSSIFIILYFIFGAIFRLEFISFASLMIIGVDVLSLIGIDKFYELCKKQFAKRLLNKEIKKVKRHKTIKIDSLIVARYYRFVFIYLVTCGLVCLSYYTVLSLGKLMGTNIYQPSYDEIIINADGLSGESNIIIGNIISYKDNVFYISDENKELITIKNNTVKTRPYKEKK